MSDVITLGLKDVALHLRALSARNAEAILKATHRTAELDAMRWIQWSIRGGGRVSSRVRGRTSGVKKARPKGSSPSSKPTLGGEEGIGQTKKSREPAVAGKVGKKKGKKRGSQGGYRIPIDTGNYAGSWRATRLKDGAEIWSAAAPQVKAGVIEEGRRPAPIPITPLARWVKRKFGVGDDEEARGIAFAISKYASKNRRPGLHVLARARAKIFEALKKNVERELERAARRRR